jgi:hypothetical protein
VARPRKPEGALVTVATRIPEPIRDRADEIAASQGMSRSAWLARVVTRAVESYPLDED